jgi:DNA-directed RNA polymerase subunit L
MELKTIKETTKELELEITGENETILNPITEVLLQDKNVDYASYMADHPESNKRRLYIRVKQGKPKEVLLKAVKQLENEVKTFSKNFEVKSKGK